MRRPHLVSILLALVALLVAAPAAGAASGSPVKHVRVNGISIGYRTVGSGQPLVLIPGFAFTMAEWDPKLVGALSARHRVVLFDNRGVATSTDAPRNVLSINEMASDTAGLIRALHLGRPDVLGWSMGGYVAQELAVHNPGLVRRLILASTDFGGANAVKPSNKVISELEHANQSELLGLLFPRKAISAGNAWEARIGVQFNRLRLPADSFTTSTQIIRQQFDAAGPGWEARGKGSYNQLPRLTAPTLIAAGAQDVIVPERNSWLLHRRIHDSALAIFPAAGHAFLFQTPLTIGRTVNRFLS